MGWGLPVSGLPLPHGTPATSSGPLDRSRATHPPFGSWCQVLDMGCTGRPQGRSQSELWHVSETALHHTHCWSKHNLGTRLEHKKVSFMV